MTPTSTRPSHVPGSARTWSVLIAALVVAAVTVVPTWSPRASAAEIKQKLFASPEEAAEALVAAVKAHSTNAILEVLGPEAKSVIHSGDPVADREAGEHFVEAYEAAHSFDKSGDAKAVLQTGKDDWPFPIPLVKVEGGWRFDSAAGKEEIIDRRIGRNELSAIQASLAYADAQREYYARNPDGAGLLYYAQKIASTKGKRDGLYWDSAPDEVESPLGPLFVAARTEGYKPGSGKPAPYHGYYYRILTAQGPDAPGGAYNYVANGKMIGGFALIAYPAVWDSSGVMTFLVNHDGVVYQKDLGPDTTKIAQAMKTFNPDSTWKPVDATDHAPPEPAPAS